MSGMLKRRTLSALGGIPVLFAIVWWGKPWLFTLLVAVIALLAATEFYRMAARSSRKPLVSFGLLWILLLILSPRSEDFPSISLLVTTAVVLPPIWLVFRSPRSLISNWAWTLAAILYVGWMLSRMVALRDVADGREWVIFALFATFAADTSAFFVGRAVGSHLLAPAISPGKTWEGAIAGLLGAVAASLLLASLLDLPLGWGQKAGLGCIIGVLALVGDLAESWLKRRGGVKDSGRLIPGHGGILDRVDSLVLTGAVMYYYVIWVV